MISEHIDHLGLQTPCRIHVPSVTFVQQQLAAIGAMARKLSVGVATWIRIPVLPYAALWEASLLVSLLEAKTSLDQRERCGGPVSHGTDAWLCG
jgi:hypothetical protein